MTGGSGIGIANAAAGTVNVTGNTTGGSTSNSHGISNLSTGIVTVSGSAQGGFGSTGAGVSNTAGGVATVGRAIGNNYGPGGGTAQGLGISGVSILSTSRNYAYALEYGPFGMVPVTGHVRLIADAQNSVQVPDSVTLAPIILAETASDLFPTADDVREGVVYMGVARTGQLIVPDPANVAVGVPTDDTVGTALLSAAAAAAAILDALTADHDTAGTIGLAIGSGGGGGGASAEEIADQVRVELTTELAFIDVAVSSRNAIAPDNAGIAALSDQIAAIPTADLGTVWDALRADHADPDSFGAVDEWASVDGGGGGATAEEIWEFTPRTLTQTAAEVAAAVSGSDLAIVRAVTFTATLTGLTIPAAWTRLYFTAKLHRAAPDTEAIVQIAVSNPAAPLTDGLLRINRAEGTLAHGSLVVNQGAGTVAITVADDATALLVSGMYVYDAKVLLGGSSTSYLLTAGNLPVSDIVTESIA